MKWTQIVLAALVVLVSFVGQIGVKAGLSQVRDEVGSFSIKALPAIAWKLLLNPPFVGGFLIMVVSAFLYLALLYTTEISRALPVMGAIGYVVLLLIAWLWLKESVTGSQIAGLGAILAGIWLISR
jgi:multidrug transporter EmrE-like cation transporter